MATNQKAAAKPAAKQVKQAPAPAPAPETDEVQLEVGQQAKFLGYGEDVPEAERVLTEGETYEIVGFTEADGDDPGGDPIVKAPNPDFNAKKKEHPDTNPKFIEVQVFAEELEIEGEAEAEPEAEAAPAPAAKKAPAKTAPAKTPAKAAEKAPAGKKVAAAKKTAKAEEPAPEPVDPDAVPELESEDADVLALVDGSEDLIATAQELDANVATSEYQLGGILYHIKKDKLHHALTDDKGNVLTEYAEKGGWEKFLTDYFNIEYRKAQWLLEIYIHFNQAGVTDAAAKVAQIGWTKAKTIAKELTKEGANVEDLLTLAEENTVADLVTAIRDSEHVGGTAGEKKKRLTLKFRYLEADAATVEQGLEAVKDAVGLKDIGEALLHLVTEYIAEHGGAATKAAAPAQKTAAKAAPAKKAAPRRAAAAA